MNDATKLSLRWVLGLNMEPVSHNEAMRRVERAHRWLQLHETTLRRVATLACVFARPETPA